jgi:hypothetical protein
MQIDETDELFEKMLPSIRDSWDWYSNAIIFGGSRLSQGRAKGIRPIARIERGMTINSTS